MGFGVWGLHLWVEGVEEVEQLDGPRERRGTLRSGLGLEVYRGTSRIGNTPLLGPYGRTIRRVLWWSWGGGEAVSHERGTPVGFGVRFVGLSSVSGVEGYGFKL